jgi:hypothetical protein
MLTTWRAVPLAGAGAIALALSAADAQAAVIDPIGDLLPTFDGPETGDPADLDVTRVDARLTGPGEVVLTGTHAGAIGTTPGAAYVWGIDRGLGTPRLTELFPPVGAGVNFDAVAVLDPAGVSVVVDLLDAAADPVVLDASAVSIDGNTISVTLTEDLLPSAGSAFAAYEYNLWPRYAPGGVDAGDNTQISDFAPDASTFMAAIPLPGALALQLAGIAVLGAVGSRRRLPQVTPG